MREMKLSSYYSFLPDNVSISVPDALADAMEEMERAERAYQRKRRWHHAQYSLNYLPDMDRIILNTSPATDTVVEEKEQIRQLREALAVLPGKQAMRIYFHYFLGYSKADIARNEGVSKTAVSNSIAAGLRRMRKALDNFI